MRAVGIQNRDIVALGEPVLSVVKRAQRPLGAIIEDLDLDGLARRGGLEGAALEQFMAGYLEIVIDLHHPGYMGHQVAVPHHAGGLGALIDGILNNPMAIYEMGPGAAAIEYFVVNWLLQRVGWAPSPLQPGSATVGQFGGGVLTLSDPHRCPRRHRCAGTAEHPRANPR